MGDFGDDEVVWDVGDLVGEEKMVGVGVEFVWLSYCCFVVVVVVVVVCVLVGRWKGVNLGVLKIKMFKMSSVGLSKL